MANYYHEARAHVRKLKEMQEDNRRRAERRAEVAGVQAEHPLNLLVVDGRTSKFHKNNEHYNATEKQESLIPWNGQSDNLIDRFDARALLDFYREPLPSTNDRSKRAEERKLNELLTFERYRDLVRLKAKGFNEQQGLHFAAKENIEKRAAARAAAAALITAEHERKAGVKPPAQQQPAGQGAFAAVGFTYTSEDVEASSSSSEDEDADLESDADEEQLAQDLEDDRLDELAEDFDIKYFSYRLQKALIQEGEQEEAMLAKPRRRLSRKKFRERSRRMQGQGLNPNTGAPLDWAAASRQTSAAHVSGYAGAVLAHSRHLPSSRQRGSPDYHDGTSRGRSRSRSRSKSPRRRENRPRMEFISEFTTTSTSRGASLGALPFASTSRPSLHAAQKAAFHADDSIIEALPDKPDPAVSGALHFPAQAAWASAIQQRKKEAQAERERDRGRHSRSRSRSRGRSRSRSRSRDRYSRHSGDSYSRSHGQGRSRERSRDRDRDRDRGRDHDRRAHEDESSRDRRRSHESAPVFQSAGAGLFGSLSGFTPVTRYSANPARPAQSSAAAAAAAPARETPAERLKRIMAAQLNKQLQKDTLVATHKMIQVEKERQARLSIQAAAAKRSPSPSRRRSRSQSPDFHHDRSRRSRSKSPRR